MELLSRRTRARLSIVVTSGAGSGRTPISAFDAALCAAGAGNFNLVRLSSVIPAGSRLVRQTGRFRGDFGDLLYCVYADGYAGTSGQEAWAGLGWVTTSTGSGLFVEHSGDSRAAVEEQIHMSLTDMVGRRNDSYGPIELQLSSALCRDRPVCAVVLAAYRTVSWRWE
jgi:arginine decarboxylase